MPRSSQHTIPSLCAPLVCVAGLLLAAALLAACGGEVGDSCTEAAECSSQMCLLRKDGTGFCTESCETDDDCPGAACPDPSETPDAGSSDDNAGSDDACAPSDPTYTCQDLGGEINRVCAPHEDS